MKAILALDQGTTSSRALVVDGEGRCLGMAQKEFAQHFPHPGWVEHDAEEIWTSQLAVAKEALGKAGVTAKEIAGIGITNQRETTVVWDRETGEPVHRAIVWQDRRTAERCRRLTEEGVEARVQERTGLLVDPYFSGTKIGWLLDHVEGARSAAEAGRLAFGTVDSWLIWKLTRGRVHATDVTNASRTLLMNLATGEWDEEMLEMFGVPESVLPEIVASSGVAGDSEAEFLGGSIPIGGVVGDQQGALFGQLCVKPGMIKNTYGTGCFLLMNAGEEPAVSRHRLLSTPAWKRGDGMAYALEGSVFSAGSVVQWLRDGLGLIRTSGEVEGLAASVPDAGGVRLVPAFTGLGAPYWDAEARGTLCGLTRGTTAAHVARAALEGIAYQVADVVRSMGDDAGKPLTELRVDGGASVNNLLMQVQADLLGIPVIRPKTTESTAMGAAFLAGLATGVWSGVEDLDTHWQVDRVFDPAIGEDERNSRLAGWSDAVARARSEIGG
ncbi:MAG TPA: glycerol kinase GlpK [Kiritimatiellia bacterium]|nr:glycerol kinase GlpK [Kiritimatiellia bacterium]